MTSPENLILETVTSPVALASSSNGRTSGKPWKSRKSATVRSHIPNGVKAKSWQDRMEKTKKEMSIKKLQTELKDEKQAEISRYGLKLYADPSRGIYMLPGRRRQVTMERKKAAEERRRLEEEKAKVRPTTHSSLSHRLSVFADGTKKSC